MFIALPSNRYTSFTADPKTVNQTQERPLGVLQKDLEDLFLVQDGNPVLSPTIVKKDGLFVNTLDVKASSADLERVLLELQQELTEAEENDLLQKFG